MSIKIASGVESEWYTPSSEDGVDEDQQASFKLAPLTGSQMMEIWEFFDEQKQTVTGKGILLAAKLSIKEWKNVNDANDKLLKCTRFNLEKLPFEVLAEVGAQAVSISTLDAEQRKNL